MSARLDSVTANGLALGALLRGWIKDTDTRYRHPLVEVRVSAHATVYVITWPAEHEESGRAEIRLPMDSTYGTVVDACRAMALLVEARG